MRYLLNEALAFRSDGGVRFMTCRTPCRILAVANKSGSTDVVVGHFRPGSAGQRPPRVSMAMAISASGLWNP